MLILINRKCFSVSGKFWYALPVRTQINITSNRDSFQPNKRKNILTFKTYVDRSFCMGAPSYQYHYDCIRVFPSLGFFDHHLGVLVSDPHHWLFRIPKGHITHRHFIPWGGTDSAKIFLEGKTTNRHHFLGSFHRRSGLPHPCSCCISWPGHQPEWNYSTFKFHPFFLQSFILVRV